MRWRWLPQDRSRWGGIAHPRARAAARSAGSSAARHGPPRAASRRHRSRYGASSKADYYRSAPNDTAGSRRSLTQCGRRLRAGRFERARHEFRVPQRRHVPYADDGPQVAVPALMVEAVPDDELIGDVEAFVTDRHLDDP